MFSYTIGKAPFGGLFLSGLLGSHQCNHYLKQVQCLLCYINYSCNYLTSADCCLEQDVVSEAMFQDLTLLCIYF